MMSRCLLLAAIVVAPLAAQDDPQLVWQGQVDGVSLLRVRGDRMAVEQKEGRPVERQRFHFYAGLPESRQRVRLEVLEGRGFVQILEQPSLENNYTLSVSIEDRQGGSSFYSLAFFWQSNTNIFPFSERSRHERTDSLTWSGRVDGEAVVSCRGNSCRAEARSGAPVTRDRFRFSRPLPDREVMVSLGRMEGRGQIRLIEQPRDQNGYTARVVIRDPYGGASDYTFSLVWSVRRDDSGFEFARGGLTWSGRVNGRVRVRVAGRAAASEVIGGAPVVGERVSFTRGLPARDNPRVTLRKLRGRGRVEIVEYPSARNRYQLVFEIEDSGGGPDQYEVEVSW